jgi:hypothetical protein
MSSSYNWGWSETDCVGCGIRLQGAESVSEAKLCCYCVAERKSDS